MTEDTYTVAVITTNYYGFGNTKDEALDACRRAGGGNYLIGHGYMMWEFSQPLHFEVTDFGGLQWRTPDGTDAPKESDATVTDRTVV